MLSHKGLSCGDATRLRAKKKRQQKNAVVFCRLVLTSRPWAYVGLAVKETLAVQIHPETACSKLLRTDKKFRRQNAVGYFCRLVLTPRPWAYVGLAVKETLAVQIHPETACSKLLRTGKKFRRQNAVGYFCRLVLTPRPWAYMGLVVVVIMIATHRHIVFWTQSCSPLLGFLLTWFYAVTRISARCQRASITLPRATFHACATRKHFTRRSNDRRISCLRDSADISPPGAACPACPRPWAYIIQNKRKAANTLTKCFHFFTSINLTMNMLFFII